MKIQKKALTQTRKKTFFFSGFLLLLISFHPIANAENFKWESISIGGGRGDPDQLKGARIAARIAWPQHLNSKNNVWQWLGFWEISAAHFTTERYLNYPHEISAIAFAPVVRLARVAPLANTLYPYAELSVGPSVLSHKMLGHRNLGSAFEFQDLLGLGLRFGDQKQFELSCHYLHYSNAGIAKPNQGIDVKGLISLTYRF